MWQIPRLTLPLKLAALAAMAASFVVWPIVESSRWAAGTETHRSGDEVLLVCQEDAALQDYADRVASHLARDRHLVDRLLPEGAGGTRFVLQLPGDHLGEAHQETGAIDIAVTAFSLSGGVSTELHERAHLLQFARPHDAARLLARLPRPAHGTYAATNGLEHFAEMASEAWSVLQGVMPGDFCIAGDPVEWLRQAEARVPGTSGMLAWYLRAEAFSSLPDYAALEAEAARLMTPVRAEWDALFHAITSRRQSDGTLQAWPAVSRSTREHLEARRWAARLRGGFFDRLEAAQLTASLWVQGSLIPRGG